MVDYAIQAPPLYSWDIAIPDTVDLGAAFPVQVTTFGDGCHSKGETEVAQHSDGTATVTPYDYISAEGLALNFCTRELNFFRDAR